MDQNRIPKTPLRWTPPGKRKKGRPKTTWRRTVNGAEGYGSDIWRGSTRSQRQAHMDADFRCLMSYWGQR